MTTGKLSYLTPAIIGMKYGVMDNCHPLGSKTSTDFQWVFWKSVL